MEAGVGGLPANYFGGYFWWYFAEEYKVVTPWINAAVGGGSVTKSVSVTLSASPASISPGQSSTLTYASQDAASCTGTGFTVSGLTRVGEGLALSHDHLFDRLHRHDRRHRHGESYGHRTDAQSPRIGGTR